MAPSSYPYPPPDISVFADPTALASGAAGLIAGFIKEHASNRPVTVAMAGGSTPIATYRHLAGMDVPWDRVCAWVGDERYLPPDHPDSNGGMISRLLLDGTDARFLKISWEEGRSAHQAAAIYEKDLLSVMAAGADGPQPDLVLVGIGDDGHTLSLFPHSPTLDIADRWYVADRVEAKHPWRLTATFPLVHRARQIYVLVSGAGKATALAESLNPVGGWVLPARRLMDGPAPVTWLVDRAAASFLPDEWKYPAFS